MVPLLFFTLQSPVVFSSIIFAASSSYELIGWHQNEPQWRRLNVEGVNYFIDVIINIFILDCLFLQKISNYICIANATSLCIHSLRIIYILQQVRELVDKATNIVMNYTETEAKVCCKKMQYFALHNSIRFFLKGSRSNK